MSFLTDKRLFLLDMDGTIYLGNKLFDGTVEFLEYIKSIGGRYMFLTNNSSKSVEKYIKKLADMGISAVKEDFVTSINATVKYLKEKSYSRIYAFGTASFKKQLADEDLPITDILTDDIDCLCMGFDTELTFKKLEDACVLIGRGVDYIATNTDWVCPTEFGYVPDCGSISQILFNATGKKPRFIGKPEPDMVYLAMEKAGVSKERTVLVGDRLYTDIASGVNAGISTVMVLSGECTMADVQEGDVKPEYIFENLKEMHSVMAAEN